MTVGVTRGVIGEDLFFMEDLLTNLASKEAWFHSVKNFDRLGSLLTDIIAGTCPYPVPNPDLPGKSYTVEMNRHHLCRLLPTFSSWDLN